MKRLIPVILGTHILILLVGYAWSQSYTLDSPRTNSETESNNIDTWIEKSNANHNINNYLSLYYASVALQKSINQKSIHYAAASCINIAETNRLLGNPQEAELFAYKAFIVSRVLNAQYIRDQALGTLANIYYAQSDFPSALKYTYYLLTNAENDRDTAKIIAAKVLIGNIEYARGAYENSYKEYLEVLNMAKSFSNLTPDNEFTLHQNIANVLLDLQNLNEAKIHIVQAAEIADELQSNHLKITTLTQEGYLYYENKEFERSISLYSKALKLSQEISAAQYIASSFMEIGRSYHNWALITIEVQEKSKLLDEAINFLNRASEKFLTLENTNEHQYCQELLSECYELKGNYKNALSAYKNFRLYQDSLFNAEKIEEITSIKLNYKFSKQQDSIKFVNEQQILIKELQIEQNKEINLFLVSILMVFLILGFLLIKQNKIIKEKNAALALSNATKLQMFNMINHDLRSPIANLLQSLYIQKDNPNYASVTEKNIQTVEHLYHSMNEMLLWSKGQMENFQHYKRPVYLSQIIESVIQLYPNRVSFELFLDKSLILETDEDALKAILRNLVSNALNALKGCGNPIIRVSAWEKEKKVFISISDNGPGTKLEQFDALFKERETLHGKSGLGLHIVRDLLLEIDGSIDVQTEIESGTTITISINT